MNSPSIIDSTPSVSAPSVSAPAVSASVVDTSVVDTSVVDASAVSASEVDVSPTKPISIPPVLSPIETYIATLYSGLEEQTAAWVELKLQWAPETVAWIQTRLNRSIFDPLKKGLTDDVACMMIQFVKTRRPIPNKLEPNTLVGVLRTNGTFQKVIYRNRFGSNIQFVPLYVYAMHRSDKYHMAQCEMTKHNDFFYDLNPEEKREALEIEGLDNLDDLVD